jgi:dTDP-glucose 4,6-dehydratase
MDSDVILVTGGAGFIGCNFLRTWLAGRRGSVVNLDKLTYAGSPANLTDLANDSRHVFVKGDICDASLVDGLLKRYHPGAIVHFAAESHVDRSIHGPEDFIQTNVVGTFRLLDCARGYWETLRGIERDRFRFLHVSTDEVYGSLESSDPPFVENTPYAPNSPYAASKAGSDHLVRAYHNTYGLPTLTTNCSNNYGPYQFPEKLIPLMALSALEGRPLPVYGDGQHVRDWLYVADHIEGLRLVLERGVPGETYNIGGGCEKTNLEVVQAICSLLDELRPGRRPHAGLIDFVSDRRGHDRRYAIDIGKVSRQLGWKPRETFDSGLRKTVEWYLANDNWRKAMMTREYQVWLQKNYVLDDLQ